MIITDQRSNNVFRTTGMGCYGTFDCGYCCRHRRIIFTPGDIITVLSYTIIYIYIYMGKLEDFLLITKTISSKNLFYRMAV